MRRRDFISLIGGTAATWPLAAHAQQAMPVIGFLRSTSPDERLVTALRRGLQEVGLVDGQNVAIEYRWADDRYERLPVLAAELVAREVAVIIVFITGEDPVRIGLVASLDRPGGNVTGVSFLIDALSAKSLEILHQLLPNAVTIAVLVNPNNPQTDSNIKDLQVVSRSLGLQMQLN